MCVYILSILQIPVSVGGTITAFIAVESREFSHVTGMAFFGVTLAGIALATILLILQTFVIAARPEDEVAPEPLPNAVSSRRLAAWNSVADASLVIAAFVFSIVAGATQMTAVTLRHLIPSPWRLPEQFQPFVAKIDGPTVLQNLEVDDKESLANLCKKHESDPHWQLLPREHFLVCYGI